MDLRVLGALEVRDGNRSLAPRRRLVRVLLGALALRANMPLSTEAVTEALWAGSPPRSAAANLRSYVAEVRRLVPGVEAVHGGYLLRVGVNGLDSLSFLALADEGRRHLAEGTYGLAADKLSRALGLWRGPVLAGLALPDLVAGEARLLEDRRLDAVEDGVDARLALGQHADLTGQLPVLLAEHGLRERLWGQLMLALYRSGRQAEALAAYQRLYRILAEDLGVTPGPASQDLHLRILRSDPTLGLREAAAARTVPWQLPPVPATFVGRAAELAALDALLRPVPHEPVTVAVLAGTAGVGKTALALHWAHGARGRFPDGCLYADLRGFGPDQPRTPEEVLAEFLRALGVGPEGPPEGSYRTELAGRRMLVILDNAYSADQVRPLLPGDSCAVLVTSRDALTGLVARDGAHRLDVGLLPAADADGLLRTLIGDRAVAGPELVTTLAERCARLPLALRIAAELVDARAGMTLAELAGELADEQSRLDVLDAGGDAHTAVRSVLSWSTRHLTGEVARAFRLFGLYPGRAVDAHALAALADAPARPLLAGLLRAHLLHEVAPGRYSAHDLLRDYAREVSATEAGSARRAAVTRLLDQRAYTASVAMDLVYPYDAHRRPKAVAPVVAGPALDGADAARVWLDTELEDLLALLRLAADGGWPAHVAILSGTLHRHLHTLGRYTDMLDAHGAALAVAQAHADRRAEGAARVDLGMALVRLGRYDEATDTLTRALAIQVDLGDELGESAALHGLGMIDNHRGRLAEALGHFGRALDINRRLGDRGAEGATLGNIGLVHEWMGDWERAVDYYGRALAIHRDTGFRTGEGDTLNNLGIVYRQIGDYPLALRHLGSALAVYRAAGDRGGEGAALNNLGLSHTYLREWAPARRHLEDALAVHRDIGSRVAEVETRNILGVLAYRSERFAEGVALFRGTLAVTVDLGVPGAEMNTHYGLGQSLRGAGEPAAAMAHYEVAGRLAEATGARSTATDVLAGLARCLGDLGRPAEAADYQRRALEGYAEMGVSPEDRL